MIGTPAWTAIRAAPALRSLTVKLVLIVASGKTPTTSPSLSARTAASNAAAPALRSTGMCCMARMNGPENQWSKTADLAMNRTSRCCGSAPSPRKVKSKKLTWLLQMIAPPRGGHVLGAADVEAEAEQPEDDQRQPDDEPVGPVPADPGSARTGRGGRRRASSRCTWAESSPRRPAAARAASRVLPVRDRRPPRGRRRRGRRSPGARRRCRSAPVPRRRSAATPVGRRAARRRASASAARTWSSRAASDVGRRRRAGR